MYAKIRPRRGTTTEWNTINPVLLEGELGIEFPDTGISTGLCKMKIGDGYSKWSELKYAFDANSATAIYGGTPSVSNDVCVRSGTTDEWESENPVLKVGEFAFDITKNSLKCGDGVKTFTELDYITSSGGGMDDQDYDFGDIDAVEAN